jgi:hypothetical protein
MQTYFPVLRMMERAYTERDYYSFFLQRAGRAELVVDFPSVGSAAHRKMIESIARNVARPHGLEAKFSDSSFPPPADGVHTVSVSVQSKPVGVASERNCYWD